MGTTYELTWQESRNNAYSPASADDLGKYHTWFIAALLLGLVPLRDYSNNLIGSPAGVATCIGSSDGVTGALDGVNRWGTSYNIAKLVTAVSDGTAHSWMVLKTAWGLYIRLDLSGQPNSFYIDIECSFTAYSGGSATTRPTSTNTFRPAPGIVQKTVSGSPNCHFHGWLSTTGEAMICHSQDGNGFVSNVIMFRQLAETHQATTLNPVGDNHNGHLYFEYNAGGCMQDTGSMGNTFGITAQGWQSRCTNTSTTPATTQVNACAELPYSYGLSNYVMADMPSVDPVDGLVQDLVIRLYTVTAGFKSRRGRLKDICWCPQSAGNNKVEPPAASPGFTNYTSVTIGHTYWPWHDPVNAMSL